MYGRIKTVQFLHLGLLRYKRFISIQMQIKRKLDQLSYEIGIDLDKFGTDLKRTMAFMSG